MEIVAQQEYNKQQDKMQAKYAAEEEARIQLMREVYESRAQNVEYKKLVKNDEKWLVGKELEVLNEKLRLEDEQTATR